jgi:hypothetical protein
LFLSCSPHFEQVVSNVRGKVFTSFYIFTAIS